MNIIIDTNILKQDRQLSKPDLLLIRRLSNLGFIKLHFPWVIYKEFTSQNQFDILKEINDAIKCVSSLNNKGLGRIEHEELLVISDNLKLIKEKVSISVEHNLDDIISASKSITHDFDDSHGRLVMTSYFNGKKPFSSLKNRKDIPDAFIYESIINIKNKYGLVIFISEDDNLRDSCNLIPNVKSFETLSEFFESDEYKKIETEYKKIESYADDLIELEKHDEFIKSSAELDIPNEFTSLWSYETIHKNIPSDNNDATITFVGDVIDVEIDKQSIKFIDDIFYIRTIVTGFIHIEYFLFKMDIFRIDNRKSAVIIDNDWNKHYFLIEEEVKFVLSCNYSIHKDLIRDNKFELEKDSIKIEDIIIMEK